MSLLPVQSAGQALAAVSLAGSAASTVSSAFSALLRNVLDTNAAGHENQPRELSQPDGRATVPAGGVDAGQTPNSIAVSAQEVSRLREQLQALARVFDGELRQLLAESGIDPSVPIEIEIDALGQLRVGESHPDKKQIEALLADRPELASLFESIAARARLLESFASSGAMMPDWSNGMASGLAGSLPDSAGSGSPLRLLLGPEKITVARDSRSLDSFSRAST